MKLKDLLLLLAFTLFTLGCKDNSRDPQLEEQLNQARNEVIELFDSYSAENQDGFLLTFRPSAEATAKQTFTGKELSERLEFIAELEAELLKRKK